MKKKNHKYKLNDTLKFRYFEGGIYTGKVTKVDYEKITQSTFNYSVPTYTITVKEKTSLRGVKDFHYPCITEDRIISKVS